VNVFLPLLALHGFQLALVYEELQVIPFSFSVEISPLWEGL
jgi:hypothetical protein